MKYGRDSSVITATGYRLEDGGIGVQVPVRQDCPDRIWGRSGPETDLSPPTSAKVKKMWIYTSTSHTPSWHSD
jgi:hypothetical protein